MMEFLDKIYGYEHFGIILFAVIAVLVVLFLIVLFFGKKDEKKRDLEKTKQMEAQKVADGFANVNPEPVSLNVNEPAFSPVEEMVQPVINESPVVNPEPVVQSVEPVAPVVESAPIVEPIAPVIDSTPVAPVLEPAVEPQIVTPVEAPIAPVIEAVTQPEVVAEPISVQTPEVVIEPKIEDPIKEIDIPNFNFDELAASIANELNALENKNLEPVKEEVTVVEEKPVFEPIASKDPVTPIAEVVKPTPTPGPAVFSSVYINKPVEPVKEAQVVEPVVPVTPVAPTAPVQNPGIELPKPAEMPALNKEVNTPTNNTPNAIPDFSQFEGESYNINK